MRKLWTIALVALLVVSIAAWAGEKGKGQSSGKPAATSTQKEQPATAGAGNKSKMTGAINGWISDDKCGAKGANEKAEACTKKCIQTGAKPVFVSDANSSVWGIQNPGAIRGHEGHHVTITGAFDQDKKSVNIESLRMMASTGSSSGAGTGTGTGTGKSEGKGKSETKKEGKKT